MWVMSISFPSFSSLSRSGSGSDVVLANVDVLNSVDVSSMNVVNLSPLSTSTAADVPPEFRYPNRIFC